MLLAPFLAKKAQYQTDAWGYNPSDEVDAVFLPMVKWIGEGSPEREGQVPDHVEHAAAFEQNREAVSVE